MSSPNMVNHKLNTPALIFEERLSVCSFLMRSLPYLLINLQETVYTMLTQIHSLAKKPKYVYGTPFYMLIKKILQGTTMIISQ